MSSINQQVWKLISGDVSIQKGLKRDIINIRGLAKFFMKRYGVKASLDSVISAIRRYDGSETFTEEELTSVFKHCIISTKNNVACITVRLDALKHFPKLLEMQANHQLNHTKFLTGPNSVKIITDNVHKDKILGVINEKAILTLEEDLSEISISLSQKAISTKGVLARMANELALNNINIVEMLVAPPDFLVYVKEKDIVKTHEALLKLSE